MARHFFYPTPWRLTSTVSNVGGRANAISIRDLFRSGDGLGFSDMNIALNSSRWKVSDIGYLVETSNEEAYVFLLRDTTAGIEYFFVINGMDAVGSPSEQNDYFPWTTTHVQPIASAPGISPGGGGMSVAVFLNVDYATSSWGRNWGFDNATEMTFSGGDFKNLTATSDPKLLANFEANWVPVGVDNPRGALFVGSSGLVTDGWAYCVVIDDIEHSLAVFLTDAYSARVDQVACFSMNMFVPNTAGDTYLQGMLWMDITTTTASVGTESTLYADGFTNAGVKISDFTVTPDALFTQTNEKTGGLYKWRSLPAISSSFDKGWINPNIAVEIGASNSFWSFRQRYALPDTSNPVCKYSNNVATMWAPNIPAFPFPYNGIGEGP